MHGDKLSRPARAVEVSTGVSKRNEIPVGFQNQDRARSIRSEMYLYMPWITRVYFVQMDMYVS